MSEMVTIPREAREPVVTDEMVTRAFAAWQGWRDYDDEARMRAALVAAMRVQK